MVKVEVGGWRKRNIRVGGQDEANGKLVHVGVVSWAQKYQGTGPPSIAPPSSPFSSLPSPSLSCQLPTRSPSPTPYPFLSPASALLLSHLNFSAIFTFSSTSIYFPSSRVPWLLFSPPLFPLASHLPPYHLHPTASITNPHFPHVPFTAAIFLPQLRLVDLPIDHKSVKRSSM
ncbi:hypothetical protein L211DRAFT_484233 [Terfezia boudieri ATCC MYA-4762]|uniref:Uncharacterized protein n=1 Tax=Terfezia boudieri ATCC MYA-4762 TaxID=1051890 RepID=A0A3N4M2H2_9PEZI|nr:hypothetical protein L211DRAFT_484233 [Terfezia boudieri ATCC MYA-4762]